MAALQNKMALGGQVQGKHRATIDGVDYEVISRPGYQEMRVSVPEPPRPPPAPPPTPASSFESPEVSPAQKEYEIPERELPPSVNTTGIKIQIFYATYFDYSTVQGGFTPETELRLNNLYRTGLIDALDGIEDISVVRFSIFYTGVFNAGNNEYTQPYTNYTDDFDTDNIATKIGLGSLETRFSYGSPNNDVADVDDVLYNRRRLSGPAPDDATHRYFIYDYGVKYTGFDLGIGWLGDFPQIIREKNIRASYWIPSDAFYGFDGSRDYDYPTEIDELNTSQHRAYAWVLDTSYDIDEAIISVNFSAAESMISFIGQDIVNDIRSVLASASVSS